MHPSAGPLPRRDEVSKGSERWATAILFYVIGMKPTLAAVHRFIALNWNSVALPEVYLHDDGYFVVRFASKDDLHSIFFLFWTIYVLWKTY